MEAAMKQSSHTGVLFWRLRRFQATALLLVFLFSSTGLASAAAGGVSIIPRPAKMEVRAKVNFILRPSTKIMVEKKFPEITAVAEDLAAKLRKATGYPLEILSGPGKTQKDIVILRINEKLTRVGNEGYLLSIGKNDVVIEALRPAGVFYGIQTLYQLLPAEVESVEVKQGTAWTIPGVKIEDRPRFLWRGVHLDVGRYFFPKEAVKKYLDYMAMYKMNTFHWHLTEDQGWRIEIKKYPKLTDIGAWRKETWDDGRPHGGFYTQEDIREVVEYAKARFITVVPEIEMPGHSVAALAAYPELSCSGGPFKVGTEWGVMHDVYCAGNEKTFELLQDVLTEVVALFPGEFVHIGGDEVPKTRWKNCVKCQERLKSEGLADEKELQSYFIKRIEAFLNSKGKRLIGWDEILEGGLAPNAAVMSWRGVAGGIEAAKAGHDVVMSPTSHCYFDYYQGTVNEPRAIGGFLPIEKVYSYEPLPADLTPEQARHVLGAQANIWTEYIPEFAQVEYMLLPRMLALSEVVWTPKDVRSFEDFSRRAIPHYDRLAAAGANFRVPPPQGLGGKKVITSPFSVTINPPFPGADVRYTVDGTDPALESPALTATPIEIAASGLLKARTILPGGRMSRVVSTSFSFVDSGQNGLEYGYYEGIWTKLPELAALPPAKTGRALDITLEPAARPNDFALLFKGFIQIPDPGDYTFWLLADDGARLEINGREVARHDGLFWLREVSGTISLQPGKHPIEVAYFQKSGGRQLEILCAGPGLEKQPLPAHWLFLK
jgi:hexosaminidase